MKNLSVSEEPHERKDQRINGTGCSMIFKKVTFDLELFKALSADFLKNPTPSLIIRLEDIMSDNLEHKFTDDELIPLIEKLIPFLGQDDACYFLLRYIIVNLSDPCSAIMEYNLFTPLLQFFSEDCSPSVLECSHDILSAVIPSVFTLSSAKNSVCNLLLSISVCIHKTKNNNILTLTMLKNERKLFEGILEYWPDLLHKEHVEMILCLALLLVDIEEWSIQLEALKLIDSISCYSQELIIEYYDRIIESLLFFISRGVTSCVKLATKMLLRFTTTEEQAVILIDNDMIDIYEERVQYAMGDKQLTYIILKSIWAFSNKFLFICEKFVVEGVFDYNPFFQGTYKCKKLLLSLFLLALQHNLVVTVHENCINLVNELIDSDDDDITIKCLDIIIATASNGYQYDVTAKLVDLRESDNPEVRERAEFLLKPLLQ